MISAVLKVTEARPIASRLDDVPKWVWWLLALTLIALRSWFATGTGLFGNFGDSDDATRLIQVREFMTSWNWFDTTTMKMGGDAGMLSHWSRLVDLPLALLIGGFNLVMPLDDAERLTHIVWPVSLLGALLWVMYRTTASVAGEIAGRLTLLLTIITPFAVYQFSIGRIDHHNVMIATTVAATLLIWANPQRTDLWRIAGVLLGLALAVGYEALAPVVALGIFIAIWGLLDRRAAEPAGAFAVALALTFALAFVATTAPSRWMDIRCDAISLNMVALIFFSTSGLAIAVGPGRDWTLTRRLAIVATMGAAGIAAFGMLEPKCLAGPEGQLPPLLGEVWLNHVAEGQSIVSELFRRDLNPSLGLLAFFLLALGILARQTWENRTPANLFLLATATVFVGLTCWQNKFSPYASFLSLIPVAIMISRLHGTADVSAATIRLAVIVFASQSFLLAASEALDTTIGRPKLITDAMKTGAAECSKRAAISDLEDLPPGLVAAHIDMTAYIAALTHHRVLAAPYHRIGNAIIANYQIFSAHDAARAAAVLKRENVDYVVICDGLDGPSASAKSWKGTLRADLVRGAAPNYLKPVTLPNPNSILHVWKVDRAALNLQPLAAAASVR